MGSEGADQKKIASLLYSICTPKKKSGFPGPLSVESNIWGCGGVNPCAMRAEDKARL
jgi:hypothetical protein